MFDFRFDWNKEFEVHIESVDLQHKQLFKIGRDIEQLLQIHCIGVTNKQLIDIVCELRDFAAYHFYEEERLMEKFQYPDIEEHKKTHEEFMDYIMGIDMKELGNHPVEELLKMKEAITDNFYKHILGDDKKMAEYILKHKNYDK